MNVITGIFVESALESAQKEKDNEFSNTAREMFCHTDEDASGQVSWNEFQKHMDDPEFRDYVRRLGIDPRDAKLLFKLLDNDQSGEIDIEELLVGMVRLR